MAEMIRKTDEEFKSEVRQLVGSSFIVLGKYRGSKVKVPFYHVDCGQVFYMIPNAFLRGQRCPKCGVIARTLKQTMTQKEFDKRIAKVDKGRYIILSPYSYTRNKLKVRCLKCNKIFYATGHNLLAGTGCPYCNHAVALTDTEFRERVKLKNDGQFNFLEPYQDTDTKILCHCNRCGYEWKISPHAFYHIKGCPLCQTNHVYTKNEFNTKLNKVYNGEYKLVQDYVPQSQLWFKHEKCGHLFKTRPADLLKNNTGCPYCCESKGERLVKSILDSLHVKYVTQKRFANCKYQRSLPFDFYLPKFRIAIEYDGSQHTQFNHFRRTKSEFKNAILRDRIKDWYCCYHNIFLIRIPYEAKTQKDVLSYLGFIK